MVTGIGAEEARRTLTLPKTCSRTDRAVVRPMTICEATLSVATALAERVLYATSRRVRSLEDPRAVLDRQFHYPHRHTHTTVPLSFTARVAAAIAISDEVVGHTS